MSKISEDKRDHISGEEFAFSKQRKEPIHGAAHVRNAIARFDQVKGVSPEEKKTAFGKIKKAAKKFGVKMTPTSASGLAKKGPAKKAAKKKAAKKKK